MRTKLLNLIKQANLYGWINYPVLFRVKPMGVNESLAFCIDMAKSMDSAKIDYEFNEDGSFLKFADDKALTSLIRWLLKFGMDKETQENDPDGAKVALEFAKELKNAN